MKKPVYLYDVNMNFIREFKTTYECAEFFDKDVGYINHNLKYYQKIRKDRTWYIIKRDFEKEKKYEDLCKEIDRLNNIINELEKYIKAEIPEEEFVNSEWYVNILDKLKALKENNK